MQDLQIGCRSLTQPLFPFFDPTDGATNGKSEVFIGPFWVLIQQAAQGRPLTNQLTFLHIIVLLGETQAFLLGYDVRYACWSRWRKTVHHAQGGAGQVAWWGSSWVWVCVDH